MSKLDFAALLCSRLCHDLVSPVGAINNGLEILEEENDASMREAVIDLITKSTQQTANKLQFFRLAFGAAGGFSAQLDTREAQKAIEALLAGSRVTLEWHVGVSSVSKHLVKMLLNLVLVASESLIRGGVLVVALDQEGDNINLSVEASGERIILQDTLKDCLLGKVDDEDLEPRTAPAYLAAVVVEELGGTLALDQTDEKLTMRVSVNAGN
ncbi:MAG: histidine phosphotransferase family protein [Kordiimonas sp.]